jgi:hypothetical protein
LIKVEAIPPPSPIILEGFIAGRISEAVEVVVGKRLTQVVKTRPDFVGIFLLWQNESD